MSRQADEASVSKSLEWFAQLETYPIGREGDFGPGNNRLKTEAVAIAEQMKVFFGAIPRRLLGTMPELILIQLRERLTVSIGAITAIASFSPQPSNGFESAQGEFITKLGNAYSTTFDQLSPRLAYLVFMDANLPKQRSDFERIVATAEDRLKTWTEGIHEKSQQTHTEANRVLELVRNKAASEEVAGQATHFGTEAANHQFSARIWMSVAGLLAAAIFGLACCFLIMAIQGEIKTDSMPQAVQILVAKLVLFSVLFSALYIAVKNMGANRHNAVVNRHRQNALQTYEALVSAGHEKSTRDIILTYSSNCIFSPQPTGYSSADSMDAGKAGSVIELINKAARGESGG